MKVGVCSWSLCPEGPDDLIEKVRATGVNSVQLALDPIRTDWGVGALTQIREAGIEILSGMMAMEGEDYSTLETIPGDRWRTTRRELGSQSRLCR